MWAGDRKLVYDQVVVVRISWLCGPDYFQKEELIEMGCPTELAMRPDSFSIRGTN